MRDRNECLEMSRQQMSKQGLVGEYMDAHGGVHGTRSSTTTVANCDASMSCLAARGYVADVKGNLSAPPDLGVSCVN